MDKNPLSLKRPCANCPFRKEGAIELREGRINEIVENLLVDDRNIFYCHKSVHSKNGGKWDHNLNYSASGNEKVCAGAAAYLMKIGRPSIGMRFGFITGMATPEDYNRLAEDIIEPI